MKLLFIANKMEYGGFTKSLIYLITQLIRDHNEVDILLLATCNINVERLIPFGANILKNDIAEQIDRYNRNMFTRVAKLVKMRRLFARMKYHMTKWIIYRGKMPRKYEMRNMQKDALRVVEKIIPNIQIDKYYDAIISWEEPYANYVLAERIESNNKIGYIHPDYIAAQFDSNIDRTILNKFNAIFVIAESSYNSICTAIPEISSKIHVVPNLINVNYIKLKAQINICDMEKGKFTIVTVARIQDSSKAIMRAINIATQLILDGLEFYWYFIGEGEYLESALQLVNKNNIQKHVKFLGSRENPYPYMQGADLFVLQSYYEGRPLVVDESMIIGTPCLITNYASSSEQIENGYNGIIVNNDFNSIYHKLYSVICNSHCLDSIRTNLRNKDFTHFGDSATFTSAVAISVDVNRTV
jgi:glycosyltransferase involved in cell wall biosynthesis